MQVAKNFYLPTEKTYTRKIYELLLTLKIEKLLTKEQILELYMNQIFLGQRAYGFAAASEIYFGKPVKDLSIAEAAMLAGLPVAPSAYNPIVNPKRATVRQQFILEPHARGRLHHPGTVRRGARSRRCATGCRAKCRCMPSTPSKTARQLVFAHYGAESYSRGLDVYLTIRSKDQEVAYRALRRGLLNYEQRQFYRGPEAYVDLPGAPDAGGHAHRRGPGRASRQRRTARRAWCSRPSPRKVVAVLQSGETITVTGDGLKPVTSGLADKAEPEDADPPRRGGARAAQCQGRLVADAGARGRRRLRGHRSASAARSARWWAASTTASPSSTTSPRPGASPAPASSPSSTRRRWRRASRRRPSSTTRRCSSMPAPPAASPGSRRTTTASSKGRCRCARALAKSKNMVSIRVLQSIGPAFAQEWITRFGFEADKHPAYLTMALGAGSVTPMQMATRLRRVRQWRLPASTRC